MASLNERLDPVDGEGGRRWAPTRIRRMTKCSLIVAWFLSNRVIRVPGLAPAP